METNDRLKSWLAAAKVSQAEMARRCEYDRHNFHHVLTGRLKPTITLAVAIDRETRGAIPVSAWAAPSESAAA